MALASRLSINCRLCSMLLHDRSVNDPKQSLDVVVYDQKKTWPVHNCSIEAKGRLEFSNQFLKFKGREHPF
jgi:hypothetical protein